LTLFRISPAFIGRITTMIKPLIKPLGTVPKFLRVFFRS
jgi:hypothetical protein